MRGRMTFALYILGVCNLSLAQQSDSEKAAEICHAIHLLCQRLFSVKSGDNRHGNGSFHGPFFPLSSFSMLMQII